MIDLLALGGRLIQKLLEAGFHLSRFAEARKHEVVEFWRGGLKDPHRPLMVQE